MVEDKWVVFWVQVRFLLQRFCKYKVIAILIFYSGSFGCPEEVLFLKRSSKGFHFITKSVVFNFGNIVCGRNIFVGWDYWKKPIHPPSFLVLFRVDR